MNTQEKSAGVLRAPEAAIQKTGRVIIVGNIGRVNQPMEQAMQLAGLQPFKDIELVDDGRLHRYRVQGDRAGSTNGWYVKYADPPAGAFGSWKTGEQHTWRGAQSRTQTVAEQAEARRRMQAIQQARDAERLAVQGSVRDKAAALWGMARPATNDHPYLVRKRVPAIGIRCLRDKLVIPLRDTEGLLHSLQFIPPNGKDKRFLSGGRISGCYYAMGRPQGSLLLCEGYATGATLWLATGQAVAVAFNAGNLPTVARALREKFPQLRIVVCADNDAQTPGNPGLAKAQEAARAVRGFLAVPRFGGTGHV